MNRISVAIAARVKLIQQMTVVGVGLIGGSLCRAVRQAGFVSKIIGFDQQDIEVRRAVELGVIDIAGGSLQAAIASSQLILLAVPVGATESVLRMIQPYLNGGQVVTDVGSSKANVLSAVERVFGHPLENFVAGHPIAGKERSGVEASTPDLFRGHRVILTPVESTALSAVDLVTEMWQSTGAIVEQLGAEQHDLVLGATSHLPHVLAYATVDTLANLPYVDEIFRFAAGGFRDYSRIVSSDPVMWRDICLENRDAILAVLDRFESHLGGIRKAIERRDGDALEASFTAAKSVRDEFLEKYE